MDTQILAAKRQHAALFLALAAAIPAGAARAAEWSDPALSWRIGNVQRAPFGSGSMQASPAEDEEDAQESLALHRYTLDIGQLRGKAFRLGAVRGVGATVGLDWTSRNDVGYHARQRMLVAGPTLMWDVPGFLHTSLLLRGLADTPAARTGLLAGLQGPGEDKVHPMLSASWGIPVARRWSFEGYANVSAARGRDEAGGQAGPETQIDMQLMYDVGAALGRKKNLFRIGIEYQFSNNKLDRAWQTPGTQGFRVKTPMLRAEYHF